MKPATRNIRYTVFDLVMGRFQWWRKLRGGNWCRLTHKAEIGRSGPWMPYEPNDYLRDAYEKLVASGEFESEDYR